MQQTMSNSVKAMLFPDAMEGDGNNVQKEKCSTVQTFDYECRRSRDDAGFPFGPTNPTLIDFTLRLNAPEDGKLFYERLSESEAATYTFLFSPTFGSNKRLTGCYDAMTVKGYVVDVTDHYDSNKTNELEEQMLISVRLLVSSIIYKGKESDKTLEINN